MLDPVIACRDYLSKQICQILHYFLEIFSQLVGLMLVCQQKKWVLVEVFCSELELCLSLFVGLAGQIGT